MHRRQVIRLLGLSLLSRARWGETHPLGGLASALEIGSAPIVKASRLMMGNVNVTITAVAEDRPAAQRAVSAAFSEMQRLEALLSFYRSESDVSRLNQAAGHHPVRVSPDVFNIINRALEVTHLTDGAFNIALGSISKRWDFLGQPSIPTALERDRLRALSHPEDIVLDPHRQEIFLRKPGMQLDLGGIGKGFMAQRARDTLRQGGIQAGIVANAGDLVLFGTRPDGQPWRIGVQHPRHKGKMLAALELTDCAVSTSGDYERFFTHEGVMYHHILDTRTLLPARDCQSVTVIGRDATLVDALATGIFVLGPSSGLQLLERSRLGEGMIIDRMGRTSISPSLEAKVVLYEPMQHAQP